MMMQWDLIKKSIFFQDFANDGEQVVFIGVDIDAESTTVWRQCDSKTFTEFRVKRAINRV
jgi:hypothetical protein